MCRNYNPLFKSWWEKAAVTVSPSPPFLLSKPFLGLAQGEGWCLIKHRLGWANNSRALLDFLTFSPWPAQQGWCSPPGWTDTHSDFWNHVRPCWLFICLGFASADKGGRPRGPWRAWRWGAVSAGAEHAGAACSCHPLHTPHLAPDHPDWSFWRDWWKWSAGQWAVQLRSGDRF